MIEDRRRRYGIDDDDKGTRSLCHCCCHPSLRLSSSIPWDGSLVGFSSPNLECWELSLQDMSLLGLCVLLVSELEWASQAIAALLCPWAFPIHSHEFFTPIKRVPIQRGSDLHLGIQNCIQTAAFLGGENQFSLPSTVGEGSGLLCGLIYSLSGQEESCSGSSASRYM